MRTSAWSTSQVVNQAFYVCLLLGKTTRRRAVVFQ